MQTLEELLRDRLDGNDPRAQVGAIEVIRGGSSTRIIFGAIGSKTRIVLGVEGNAVAVLYPAPHAEEAGDQPAPVANGERETVVVSAPAEEAVAPPGAPRHCRLNPKWVAHKEMTKASLLELARATPGAVFTEDNNKAEIADAINAATGAVAPE